MTSPTLKSQMFLKNILEVSSITARPVLYLSNGTRYQLSLVTIEASGTAVVDINSELDKLGIASYATLSGYVEIDYNWAWNPLCVTIRNVDTIHSTIFTYGVQPSTDGTTQNSASAMTQVAEGMWWKQEGQVTGFVAVANTSSKSIDASVQVSDSAGNPMATHDMTISPHGTKMLDLPELLYPNTNDGGIRVTYDGPANALAINGGLQDQAVGYSTDLRFASAPAASAKASQATIAELGLMVGAADPMMAFPAGTRFTPYSVLRNVSDAPATATPTLWWMESGAAHSVSLPSVTLAPYSTRTLDLASMLSSAGLKAFTGTFNLELDVQGKQGALQLAAGSVDQTNTYVFEVVPRFIEESASKSMGYWSTGNGDDTMVTIWNPADEAQDFTFRLIFAGGHYLLPIHLEARALRSFNISEIIEAQVPDSEGNIIPAAIHEGSATIAGSQEDVQHILVAMDAGIYNVRKATCFPICINCNGYTSFSMSPASATIKVGATQSYQALGTWSSGTQYNVANSWSSSNTSTATVNSSGVATGVNGGSANIQAAYGPDQVNTTICYTVVAPSCPTTSGTLTGTANVFDPTPNITSVSSPWNAGVTNTVQISGSGFGTNLPTLNITDPSGTITGWSVTSHSDTQITASVSIAASTPPQNATLTVTSNGYSGQGFTSGQGNSQTSPSWSVPINPVSAPAPRILFNGTDVTGTTQSVVVGQQIAFTSSVSLPAGVVITSSNWTIPGTIVGGYNASASSGAVVAPVLNGSSTTIYWVYGQNVTVQYGYCMNNGQCSPQATATFQVTGPSGGTMTSTPYSGVTIDVLTACPPITAGNWLVYGNIYITGSPCYLTGTPGMSFSPSGYSNSAGGTWWYVQMINSNVDTGGLACTSAPGLDSGYPYGTTTPETDSPATLLDSTYRTQTRSFNATMYLMWKSSSANSIPVPLGSQTWAFSTAANCAASCGSASNWTVTTNGTPGPIGGFVPSNAQQSFSGYPTWSTVSSCH